MPQVKFVQIQEDDGSLSGNIPFSVEAANVILSSGKTLQQEQEDFEDQIEDAVDGKLTAPATAGTSGQVLRLGSGGDPQWASVAAPTDAQVDTAVDSWLTAHPEATTTVEDGAITYAKLDSNLKGTVDDVTDLKSEISTAYEQIFDSDAQSGTMISVNTFPSLAKLTSDTLSLEIKHTGKNLLAYPYTYTEPKTFNGITYVVQEDGSIKASGTSTAASSYQIIPETGGLRRSIKAGTYMLSGVPANDSSNAQIVLSGVGQGNLTDFGDGITFTISEDKTYYLKLYIPSGNTVDLTFKPMLELGSVKTEWEPYKSESISLFNGRGSTKLYGGTDIFSANSDFTVTYFVQKTSDDIVNLINMGAYGDGVTDDTDIIKLALAAAKGKTLFVPEGIYVFSETLKIPTNTRIVGCGDKSVFKLADTFSLTPYSWRPEDGVTTSNYKWPFIHLDETTKDCVLENFVIEGQTSAFVDQAEIALTIMGSGHYIRNVSAVSINYFPDEFSGRTYNAPGEGFECFKANKIIIDGCKAIDCGYEGIGTERSEDITISNCYVGDTNQTGIQIHRTSKNIRVTGCIVDYSTEAIAGAGCTLHANVGVDMENIFISENRFAKGVTLIGGAENNVHFINNVIEYGSLTCNGQTYRKNWIISGNRFMSGGVVERIDNCIITNNMFRVNTGYYMVMLRGNNAIVENNIPLGSVSLVYIEPHEEE